MEYIALGCMSGTSLDGIDLSIIKSNGVDSYDEVDNYFQPYSKEITLLIKNTIKADSLLNPNLPTLISNEYLKAIQFLMNRNKLLNIDIMGIHGQTIFHDEKLKISLQIFDKKLFLLKHPLVISNFRKNDLLNGGKGAPIIPIFHKLLSNKLNLKNSIFINIGGVTNITIIDDNNISACDVCFGNALANDLISLLQKDLSFDKDGILSHNGSLIKTLQQTLLSDNFFKINGTKTLDRNYFHKYFDLLKSHSSSSLRNTLFTLWTILAFAIHEKSKYLKNPQIILCGGGRKNKTFKSILSNLNPNILNIDELGLDGDFVESQGIAYLAIRRFIEIDSTFHSTTGIDRKIYLGEIN